MWETGQFRAKLKTGIICPENGYKNFIKFGFPVQQEIPQVQIEKSREIYNPEKIRFFQKWMSRSGLAQYVIAILIMGGTGTCFKNRHGLGHNTGLRTVKFLRG